MKLIRDRKGVSKGYGFVELTNDMDGEIQAQFLVDQRTFLFRQGHYVIFKRALSKRTVDKVISKIIKQFALQINKVCLHTYTITDYRATLKYSSIFIT